MVTKLGTVNFLQSPPRPRPYGVGPQSHILGPLLFCYNFIQNDQIWHQSSTRGHVLRIDYAFQLLIRTPLLPLINAETI